MPLRNKVIVLITALTAQVSWAAENDFAPLNDPQRVFSTKGFSFLPPQGSGWLERFGKNEITYLKQTDPTEVSFYTGALEGHLRSPLATKDELLAFVRSKKDQWGDEERYSVISTSFDQEKGQPCVRYDLSARDSGAKNKGANSYLVMRSAGRFCVHPQNNKVAVDIYYSVRYPPAFNPAALISEGTAFLQGLRFEEVQ